MASLHPLSTQVMKGYSELFDNITLHTHSVSARCLLSVARASNLVI